MKSKSNPLDLSRDLGYAVTKSPEYKNLIKAEEDFLNDYNLKKLMDELEKTRSLYELSPNIEQHEANMYLAKINELEETINKDETIKSLTKARSEYDKLFKNINSLISFITDEESRITLKSSSSKGGCGGGCSSKSGGCCK